MTWRGTPGPWEADQFTIRAGGATLAMAWPQMHLSSDDSLAHMNANTKGIAAVPQMVEALVLLLAEFDKFSRYGSPMAQGANEARATAEAALKAAGVKVYSL